MELQDVLNERRSIRSYDADKKVTKEQLEIIINAAILAPSWKNLQTSRYYCILSDEMIKEFSDKCLPEFNQKNSEGAALVVTTFVKIAWDLTDYQESQSMNVPTAGDIMIWGCKMKILFLKPKNLDLTH